VQVNKFSFINKAGYEMVIEGTIIRVMETWPLQLVISNLQGSIHVSMRDDTEIRVSGGAAIGNLKMLQPGRRVRIDGNVIVLE
jgi:RNase P/RNase MRP subunit p29